jgi:hypothetical protein
MNIRNRTVSRLARCLMQSPQRFRSVLRNLPNVVDGQMYAFGYEEHGQPWSDDGKPAANPLEQFFDGNHSGPGIWKWRHYFEIYHRHLAKFRGQEIQFAEIGVFSGGSLRMWESYFGERSHIHGVDLDDSTMAYQAENVTIHIGDQEDRAFWARFRGNVPSLDVIVDDGGHTPRQQQVSLEEMLPHLRAGGVYICEDIHSEGNAFSAYVSGLVDQLHAWRSGTRNATSAIQAAIASVHVYPYVVVIEKRLHPLPHLIAERQGTEWQPPVVCRDGYGKIQGRGG